MCNRVTGVRAAALPLGKTKRSECGRAPDVFKTLDIPPDPDDAFMFYANRKEQIDLRG